MLYVDNCTTHNDSMQAILTADKLNIKIKKFLPIPQICVNLQIFCNFKDKKCIVSFLRNLQDAFHVKWGLTKRST